MVQEQSGKTNNEYCCTVHGVLSHRSELEGTDMHHSRVCAVLIDCQTSDLDGAARFWGEALGRSVDPNHPSSRGNYRMLETPPNEPIVEIQRVDHESRVHTETSRPTISLPKWHA